MASEPVKPCTHFILTRKNISALGAGLGLLALARTRVSHTAASRARVTHHSCQELGSELMTSTEVPLYQISLEASLHGEGKHGARTGVAQ